MKLESYLDSTNLKPDAKELDIIKLCEEAVNYEMAAVCIQPYRLSKAVQILDNSTVQVCTVIGFPLGADDEKVKLYSAQVALDQGANELDLVLNIGALKDKNFSYIKSELNKFMELKTNQPYTLKVIVETALLSSEELVNITKILSDIGVDYIKTSTGFASRGASIEDMHIINSCKSSDLKIKASGGIKTRDFALKLIDLGVNRIGTSSARDILHK